MRKSILTSVSLSVLLIGCLRIPAEVAEELSPPDGMRPNNYGLSVEQSQDRKAHEEAVPTKRRSSTD